MEHRQINENYAAIAQELIEKEPELAYIKDSRVRIAYLESDQSKKADKDKLVLGECEKVAAKNKWAINYEHAQNAGKEKAQEEPKVINCASCRHYQKHTCTHGVLNNVDCWEKRTILDDPQIKEFR